MYENVYRVIFILFVLTIVSAANAFPMGFPLENKSASIVTVIVFSLWLCERFVWYDFIVLVIRILELRRSVGKHLKYA